MRHISLESRERIEILALKRVSLRKIGNQLEISHRSVCNYLASDGIKTDKVRSGESNKVSDRVKTLLIRKIEAGKFENAEAAARDLKSTYDIEVSGQTIRNIMKDLV